MNTIAAILTDQRDRNARRAARYAAQVKQERRSIMDHFDDKWFDPSTIGVRSIAAATVDIRAVSRRIYRYWRQQGFSPEDARFQVGAYFFGRAQEGVRTM